uniref:Uncharacterized protein n=1 Tax=Cucumis melo TaxID=3656 RepID=A0A9I9E2L7_CUCME
MSCDCFLLCGRVWSVPLMPLRRAGIESGMCDRGGGWACLDNACTSLRACSRHAFLYR